MTTKEQLRNSSKKMDWETPNYIFNQLNKMFGPCVLDVAASQDNSLCPDYINQDQNALQVDWVDHMAFKDGYCNWMLNKCAWMNPPYGSGVLDWVKKATDEAAKGMRVIALLGAGLDTQWYRLACDKASNIIEFNGRINFCINGIPVNGNTRGNIAFVFDPWIPREPARWRIDV